MSSPAPTFLYESRVIRIRSVAPSKGPTAGGTEIVIVGEGFAGDATGGPTVDLGGASATVTSASDTQIIATTDAHAEEIVDVVVTNSDGDSATLPGGFNYTDGTPPLDLVFRTPAAAVARLARVENPPARISQALGQHTSLSFSSPVEPQGLDPVTWTCFGQLLFDGVITKSSARSEGREKTTVWDCACSGFSFLLSKRYPVGEWTEISATVILQYLMATFGSGFGSTVEPGLGPVTAKLDGSRDLWTVIVDICEQVGAKCFMASLTLYVFTVSSGFDPPDDVTDDNPDLLWPENGQAVTLEKDYSQITNSVTVYGSNGVRATVQDAQSIRDFGFCPLPVYDNALTTIAECAERAQAVIDQQAQPVPTAKYGTRDLKTMAGKTVVIAVSAPEIDDEFVIQTVEIDQLELLAVGARPRFLVTAVPSWAPAMKRAGGVERLLQKASDVVSEYSVSGLAKQPRLTGDVTSEPGGPTTIPAGSITNAQLAGCIATGQLLSSPQKDPVVAATTASISLSGLQTVDGVALAEGDRVLVKDQSDPTENGIYIASAATGLWERADDADTSGKLAPGISVVDANRGIAYTLSATAPVVLGSSELAFAPLGGDIKSDGSVDFAANQSMGGHKLTNLGTPASGTDATTKDYVDTALTGVILDDGSVPFSADQSMGSHKLTNVTDPSSAQDAATKAYVDAVATGLNFKAPVRAATTANLASLSGLLTIDGVTLVAGDRVLVKDQTAGADNGIYVAASGAWARSADADSDDEVKGGLLVFVNEGSTLEDSSWVLATDDPIVVGTTALDFVQFGAGGSPHNLLSTTHPDTTPASPSKGDLITSDGSTWKAHAVGSNGAVPVANSSETDGWEWQVPDSAGALAYPTSAQNITQNTETAISFASTLWDTDSFFSGGSPTRLTVPSGKGGKYTLVAQCEFTLDSGTSGPGTLRLYKNGSLVAEMNRSMTEGTPALQVQALVDASAGDYFELKVHINTSGGSTQPTVSGSNKTFLSAVLAAGIVSGGGDGDIRSNGTVAFAADQSMGGFKLTNVGTPTASTDAATKAYADSSGARVLLETRTASSSASLDFTTRNASGQSGATFQSDFDVYIFELVGIVPATNATILMLQMSSNGGSSFDSTANYRYGLWYFGDAGDFGSLTQSSAGAPTSGIDIGGLMANTSSEGCSGRVELYNPLSTTKVKTILSEVIFKHSNGNRYRENVGGTYVVTGTGQNAVRFKFDSGNIASGTIRCYGIRN